MHIGIDFDNTIVRYEKVFHKVAVENRLVPSDVRPGKNSVRDYLRQIGREDEWTKLQGLVYGTKMDEAVVFEDVFDFFHWCRQNKNEVSIISHKTRYPYIGPKYDLHMAALEWMEMQGFFEPSKLGLSRTQVFLELTKADKIKRIIDIGCTHFIDDLPEFLMEVSFPKNVISILFDPNNNWETGFPFKRFSSWVEILKELKITSNHVIGSSGTK